MNKNTMYLLVTIVALIVIALIWYPTTKDDMAPEADPANGMVATEPTAPVTDGSVPVIDNSVTAPDATAPAPAMDGTTAPTSQYPGDPAPAGDLPPAEGQ